jgi:hypothetical protein
LLTGISGTAVGKWVSIFSSLSQFGKGDLPLTVLALAWAVA